MEHFYQNVKGMFDFQDLYARMVFEAPNKAHFVEVGSFLGKSASFMAVEIANSGKSITFDCIDTFVGSNDVQEERSAIVEKDGDYYSIFLTNLRPVLGLVRPIPMYSDEASERYHVETLDFVFIDGAHDYNSVYTDIVDWLPKVKDGGYIGGHDYRSNCKGVWDAVRDIFGHEHIEKVNNSWLKKVRK